MSDEADFVDCDCPELDPEDWDAVESDWSDIAFLKSSLTAALGVPVGYYGKRDKMAARAESMGATVPDDAMYLLGSGRFSRPFLVEIENAPERHRDVFRPGGIAWTRLLKVPPGKGTAMMDDFRAEAEREYGRPPDETYLWYLTCRECSGPRDFETLILGHYRRP